MSEHKDDAPVQDDSASDEAGQVSETGFGGDAPDIDADAVPAQHSTPGPKTPEL